jgi:hypothetical protein
VQKSPHGSASRLVAFSPPEEDDGAWSLRNGPHPDGRRSEMLLATHGWWPWLLIYAVIIAAVAYGIYYFMKRRRAA